ncbi:MAG: hypothetical protein CBD47_09035 [Synechococcus sp. TMED187]|nr:MAG: hypothetical protein CBD47_09035 [Synechococcus sp. TMED187]
MERRWHRVRRRGQWLLPLRGAAPRRDVAPAAVCRADRRCARCAPGADGWSARRRRHGMPLPPVPPARHPPPPPPPAPVVAC